MLYGDNMAFKNDLENKILSYPKEVFTERLILNYLNMNSAFDKQQVNVVLKGLVKKGKIFEVDRKKYKKVAINNRRATKKAKNINLANKDIVTGTLRGNPNGYAFVISDNNDDLFIPHKALMGAMHGDTVMVERLTKGLEKPEGKVLRIIERGISSLVGTFYMEKGYGFVVPDIKEYYNDVFVPARLSKLAKTGDKVVVEITEYIKNKNPEGKIVEILGKGGDHKTDAMSIIRSYGFFETDHNAEIYAERVNKIGVTKSDLKGRVDYTNLPTITIDGDDAKDFDDAISLERNGKGYTLYVHIADVSHYVQEGSIVDDEAYKRCTSVYFPNEVFPMIPEALSNGLCSLQEGKIRLTLTTKISLSSGGKVMAYELNESYIKSDHRMTYNNVTKILNGDSDLIDKYQDIYQMLLNMKEVAKLLHDRKHSRGAIDFGNNECQILLDKKYNVIDIVPYDYTESNGIIEEFMILANEVVAEYFARMEYPFIYRIHEKPEEEKLKDFIGFVKACGINVNLNNELNSYHYQNILKFASETEYDKIVSRVMLRTMQKAKYSTINKGHFGLASEYYCHFTSPIRRYPDLMIHRVIKAFLEGKLDKKSLIRLESKLENVSTKSTEREIAAEQAERDADDYYKACYMEDKVGNIYEGTISGVTKFGIFVELDNTVEGMVRFEDLVGDDLEYIDGKYMIKGNSVTYKLGERINVVVASSSIIDKKIRFTLYTAKQND